jgi:uncharacterized protein YaaQ
MEINNQTNMVIVLAVLQAQDAELVTGSLRKFGISSNELSSTGAFLGRKNITLLIPVQEKQVKCSSSAAENNCSDQNCTSYANEQKCQGELDCN